MFYLCKEKLTTTLILKSRRFWHFSYLLLLYFLTVLRNISLSVKNPVTISKKPAIFPDIQKERKKYKGIKGSIWVWGSYEHHNFSIILCFIFEKKNNNKKQKANKDGKYPWTYYDKLLKLFVILCVFSSQNRFCRSQKQNSSSIFVID